LRERDATEQGHWSRAGVLHGGRVAEKRELGGGGLPKTDEIR
jgi:hypothetical protein